MFSSFSCNFSRVCHAPKRVANSFTSMSLPFTRLSAAGPGRRDREEFYNPYRSGRAGAECSRGGVREVLEQRVVKDKRLHLFEFNWKTQTENAIFAKAKRNGKQVEEAEGRKPINRSKLQPAERQKEDRGEASWGSGEKQNIVKQSWRKTSRAKQLARPQKSDKDDGKNQQTGNNRKSPGTTPSPSSLLCDASGRWLNKVRQDCATNRGRDCGKGEGVGQQLQLRSLHCAVCPCLCSAVFWGVSLDGFLTLAHCCPAHSPVSAGLLAMSPSSSSSFSSQLPSRSFQLPAAASSSSSAAPVAFPAELLFGEFRKLCPIAIVCGA